MLPDEATLQYFSDLISRELGIVYSRDNYFQLERRLEEVAKYHGLGSIAELGARVRAKPDPALLQLVLDTATNNETSFFRDGKVFQGLLGRLLPELAQARPAGTPLRIWCAACSTGQEPYSLLIGWKEKPQTSPLEITATDVCQRALTRAESGEFTQLEIQRGLSAVQLVKSFRRNDRGNWVVVPEVRAGLSFRLLNLLGAWPEQGKFDLILCRNMMIYLSVADRAVLTTRFAQVLNPGGHLVLGAGESLLGVSTAFEQREVDGAVFYRCREGVKAAA